MEEKEIVLMDYFNILWRRKWLVIISTLCCAIVAGVISFLLPQKWEIDTVIEPGKFLFQTEQGEFEEVVVASPKQIAGQINAASYNHLIAAEMKLELEKLHKLRAEDIRDTNLVRIFIVKKEVEMAKSILAYLFDHLKKDLDMKIDVEIKGVDTQISSNENFIKQKNLTIKGMMIEIKLNKIMKDKTAEVILSTKNKLKISESRVNDITEEMKLVKVRIDGIEKQQKKTLAQKKEESDAISLLLYSNEVQNNFRYYNTLDEKLSTEKITQENLKLLVKEKEGEIKQLDTQIEKILIDIDKIKNEIENINSQISLLNQRKARIDYTRLIKEPSSSLYPVFPRRKLIVLSAAILGLMISALVAFFIEYNKNRENPENKSV